MVLLHVLRLVQALHEHVVLLLQNGGNHLGTKKKNAERNGTVYFFLRRGLRARTCHLTDPLFTDPLFTDTFIGKADTHTHTHHRCDTLLH